MATAGFVMSAMGFRGCIGMIAIGALSDRYDWCPTMIASLLAGGSSFLIFAYVGANPTLLLVILFVGSFFGMGSAPIFLAIIPTEFVPKSMVGSAVGSMIMTILAGLLADRFDFSWSRRCNRCAYWVLL